MEGWFLLLASVKILMAARCWGGIWLEQEERELQLCKMNATSDSNTMNLSQLLPDLGADFIWTADGVMVGESQVICL